MSRQRLPRSEQAYEYLIAEILRGRWQPGDTLSAYALSEELDISRTPVLEALKRLEAGGFVEIIPQVGCRVVTPSFKAVTDLFAIRAALEGLAAEVAATIMSDQDRVQLRDMLQQMEAAADSGDHHTYSELNYEFHLRIIDGSEMPHLVQTARGIWSLLRYQLARLPLGGTQSTTAIHESRAEHRAILDALDQRAAKRARSGAERHARRCGERIANYLGRTGPRSTDGGMGG